MAPSVACNGAEDQDLVVLSAQRCTGAWPCFAQRGSGASPKSESAARRGQAEKRQKGRLKVGIDIPTREEIKAIVDAARGRWRPIVSTAIFTGLRASELRGLRWADVDFEKRELHVRQRADRYRARLGNRSRNAGERMVPLTPIVVNTLREWKLACPQSDLGLVFPTTGGLVEHHKNIIERGLIPNMIAAGVTAKDAEVKTARYTGLHAFRHFYASWCINRRTDGGIRIAREGRAGTARAFIDHDDDGRLRPSFPARRRRGGVGVG